MAQSVEPALASFTRNGMARDRPRRVSAGAVTVDVGRRGYGQSTAVRGVRAAWAMPASDRTNSTPATA